MNQPLFAEIILFGALDRALHYSIPPGLPQSPLAGRRVLVPLGRREATGIVISENGTLPDSVPREKVRPILSILDPLPIVPPDLMELCRWTARYYHYPLGEVLQAMLPAGLAQSPTPRFRITQEGLDRLDRKPALPLLDLFRHDAELPLSAILDRMKGIKGVQRALSRLHAMGLIERSWGFETNGPAPRTVRHIRLLRSPEAAMLHTNENLKALVELLQRRGGFLPLHSVRQHVKNAGYWIKKLQSKGFVDLEDVEELRESQFAQSLPVEPPPELTAEQLEVLNSIIPYLKEPSFQPMVLFGVTGSGKTEIYLRLIEKSLELDKGVLLLVPEIALSTQMEALFRHRFGSELAVWHSGLPAGARFDQWRELLGGRRRILLGVRSAVFMPMVNLGLILIDEEHDGSYKQDDRLRYHARDLALVRAQMLGIPIMLGSATPSLQTLHHCRQGRYRMLTLSKRVMDRSLPTIEVVDMRRESRRSRILSITLQKAIRETLERGEQALLFLNRRGFATFLICNSCGNVVQCSSCSVSLTYHQQTDCLRCHYCGHETGVPDRCPSCGGAPMHLFGFGTERVEEEARRLFPGSRIVRIDRDTSGKAKEMVERLNAIRRLEADIVIGTQMVAKGHDFPNITLVGVVNADTALQIADFRSGENTVQLLIQVAGRAGRGDKPGRVVLQTYNPSHYTIESVCNMDYLAFSEQEMQSREMLRYPPYTKFLRFLVTGADEEEVRKAAVKLAGLCRDEADSMAKADRHIAVLGPSPAPLSRLKNRYRWHLFVKSWTNADMQEFGEAVLAQCREWPEMRRIGLAIDRDPMVSL